MRPIIDPTLSLCMIVKDEEKYLPRCLDRVRSIVDDVVIVDTGSRDRTVEIARNYGARVIQHKWSHDFSEARNISLKHATCDWVLVLDADEVIAERDLPRIKELIKNKKVFGYKLIQRNYCNKPDFVGWQPNPGDYPEGSDYDGFFPSPLVRLFRRDPRIYFTGRIHELVEPSLNEHNLKIANTDIPIHHYGAVKDDSDFKRKLGLYSKLEELELSEDSRDAESLCRLGCLYRESGRFEEAKSVLQKAIRLFPSFARAYSDLALVYKYEGQFDKAIECYKKALAIDPKNPSIYYNYGDLLEKTGRIDEAFIQYKEAIRYDPNHFKSQYRLGTIYYNKNLLDDAITHFKEVVRYYPKHCAAHHNLGAIYATLGRFEEAVYEFRKAIYLDPDYETAHCNLGILFAKLNRFEEAGVELEKTLEINPRNSAATKVLQYIRREIRGERGSKLTMHPRRITNGPLRVIIFEVENGMIGRCCISGFEEKGHITKRITFRVDKETYFEVPFDIFKMVKEVIEFSPDFILSINSRGIDADWILAKVFSLLKIPVFIWYVDNPFALIKSFDLPANCINLVFDEFYAKKLLGVGLEKVYHLPLGVDPTIFKNIQLSLEEQKKYGCDVSFVGKLDLKKANLLREELKNQWPGISPATIEVINRAVQRSVADPALPISLLIQEACDELGIEIKYPRGEVQKLTEIVVEFEAGTNLRAAVIKELLGFNLKVCGDEDWLSIIAASSLVRPVPYFGDLVKIYNASKINLNISRVQLKSTVNQRVFDVPACKAFLITDWREELSRYFEIGKEVVCYRDPDELKALIGYYLEHSTEREKIAEAGYTRVISEHTYGHRIQRIVDIYHESLPALWQEENTSDRGFAQAHDILSQVCLRFPETLASAG
ncbi:MAG: tetratricopeptide repeat protein [Deltaproteobacteria bacterium]|nr:tetratricopeptide repeat protein [Deltaproteobacteria bacterium]MBW2018926.1 tetratricopeptide repeat protein [Deltaproteobacteria bacterium]MBW2073141.1 tetratricopeptide repeat protein [Deltaproteobacteria bacterium]